MVYLDFPFADIAGRIERRPTGHFEIVGFDPENPNDFFLGREEFYDTCYTERIRFPREQSLADSVALVESRLFDPNVNLFRTTRCDGEEFDFPTVALSGLAPDGGLFLPRKLNELNLERLVDLDFRTRAALILEDLLPRAGFKILGSHSLN